MYEREKYFMILRSMQGQIQIKYKVNLKGHNSLKLLATKAKSDIEKETCTFIILVRVSNTYLSIFAEETDKARQNIGIF